MLRLGGYLYTDHDPNYYFHRIFRLYLVLRKVNVHSPGAIAEYHQFRGGLNPDRLAELLYRVGFRDVKITYRVSENPELTFFAKAVLRIFNLITKVLPIKTFYSHFFIIAQK